MSSNTVSSYMPYNNMELQNLHLDSETESLDESIDTTTINDINEKKRFTINVLSTLTLVAGGITLIIGLSQLNTTKPFEKIVPLFSGSAAALVSSIVLPLIGRYAYPSVSREKPLEESLSNP